MKKTCLVIGMLLLSSVAFAGERVGFYGSAGMGLDFGSVHGKTDYLGESASSSEVESEGLFGYSFDLKLGYSLISNLAIYATGATSVEMYSLSDDNITFLYLGGGASYWLPMNFYVGGSLGAGRFTFEDAYTEDFSFSFRVSAGKDWNLGTRGGIGVEVYYQHAAVEDGSKEWNASLIGVKCNVSYR
ncbi:MAG: hypothetical protein J6Z31_04090 [Fibrobacter sp.]|nr:hypothetical protein [Fibrobacter sp.]